MMDIVKRLRDCSRGDTELDELGVANLVAALYDEIERLWAELIKERNAHQSTLDEAQQAAETGKQLQE